MGACIQPHCPLRIAYVQTVSFVSSLSLYLFAIITDSFAHSFVRSYIEEKPCLRLFFTSLILQKEKKNDERNVMNEQRKKERCTTKRTEG